MQTMPARPWAPQDAQDAEISEGRRPLTRERPILERALEDARRGHGQTLVLRGEPGFGKSTLLDHAAGTATDFRVVRVSGVASERDLPYAALQRLCGPVSDRVEQLPEPQRDALTAAFGERASDDIDRFLVGLAVLAKLKEASQKIPVLALVDDAHLLDEPSLQVLAFVGRRLRETRTALVFATRVPMPELTGLPELLLRGLTDSEAHALLTAIVPGRVDARVRERIVAEAKGNANALLALSSGPAVEQLAGGFGLPVALPERDPDVDCIASRIEELPASTRRLVVLTAAELEGDAAVLWRAATQLGIDASAADEAASLGFLEFGRRVTFCDARMRSVAYHGAPFDERRRAHQALADAIGPEGDPDRWAWHRAHATLAPDTDIADDLERSATQARENGGLAAAAAFLERSALLTPDRVRRGTRALAAAHAKFDAGSLAAAADLVSLAAAEPHAELARARLQRLQAKIAFARNQQGSAATMLLDAANALAPLDRRLARDTYLEALEAALLCGRLGPPDALRDAAVAARAALRVEPADAADLLLDGLTVRFTEGHAAAAPKLRRAIEALCRPEETAWRGLALCVAAEMWDLDAMLTLATRYIQRARDNGALTDLPTALNYLAGLYVHDGRLSAAAQLLEEADGLSLTTGRRVTFSALVLAAWRGSETELPDLIDASRRDAQARENGRHLAITEYVSAVLYNSLGRYADALDALRDSYRTEELSCWALPEVIEAAVRSDEHGLAFEACERLVKQTQASGTEWALGIEARSLALVSDGPETEKLYREAIDRLGRCAASGHLARAHLLYGEWLRRAGRRVDARAQLRVAHGMFTDMGAAAFATRADRELQATGAHARKRSVETASELTAQESQIARLAGAGHSNPEIATQLFISARTVEYHLHKVFNKLGISSRVQIADLLEVDSTSIASA